VGVVVLGFIAGFVGPRMRVRVIVHRLAMPVIVGVNDDPAFALAGSAVLSADDPGPPAFGAVFNLFGHVVSLSRPFTDRLPPPRVRLAGYEAVPGSPPK
jgi:hypothetical protein